MCGEERPSCAALELTTEMRKPTLDAEMGFWRTTKKISKTIKYGYAKDKLEEESSNTKVKKLAINPTKKNMCHLIGHNYLWKNCSNNLSLKMYNQDSRVGSKIEVYAQQERGQKY